MKELNRATDVQILWYARESRQRPVEVRMVESDSERISGEIDKTVRDFIVRNAERTGRSSYKIPGGRVVGNLVSQGGADPGLILQSVAVELAWAYSGKVDVQTTFESFHKTWTAEEPLMQTMAREWYEENRVLIAEYLLSLGR